MSDWRENENGNFIYPMGSDGIMTVFAAVNGGWKGVFDGSVTKAVFDTAEDAMAVMEAAVLENQRHLLTAMNLGWTRAKAGGYYRRTKQSILSVKVARSGKWHLSISGTLVKELWCDSAQDAMRQGDQLV